MRYVLVTVAIALICATISPAASVRASDPEFSSFNIAPGGRLLAGVKAGSCPAHARFKKVVVSDRRTGLAIRAVTIRMDHGLTSGVWRDGKHRSITFDGQWFRNHTHSYIDIAGWCPRPTS